MSRRDPLKTFFSVVGLAAALGVMGCSGSSPRDIRYGTDAEADFDAPPEPEVGDAGTSADSAAGDASEAGVDTLDVTDAGTDSGDTGTDDTGN